MLAIGAAESASFTQDRGDRGLGNPAYQCDGYSSFGFFQVYASAHYDKYKAWTGSDDPCAWYDWARDPEHAAFAASVIWKGSGLGAWSTYKNGAYKAHLAQAAEVVDGLLPPADPPALGSGYDAPVGTPEERRLEKLWPGNWESAWNPRTGYAQLYVDSAGHASYHTGDDINENLPLWNSDAHSPVYAAADGVVRFAGKVGAYWRGIVTIEHVDGVSTRYAHVENIIVGAGDHVARGDQIAQVGMSGGPGGNYHLHFDVCVTGAILKSPGHWPGANLAGVKANYVDPLTFISQHRPA